MFKDTDFNTKKYTILMFIICIAFFIIVVKAFEYLPITDNNAVMEKQKLENINSSKVDVKDDNVEQEEQQVDKSKNKHVHIDFMKQYKEENIEEIKAPNGVGYEETEKIEKTDNTVEEKSEPKVEISPEEKAIKSLYKGQKLYSNKEYSEALQEFRSVIQITKEPDLVASAYEGISQVYAANRKYGTALSFAGKAYSISPSSSREILLARLYYKTGDIEKATKRINNVLHRDFSNN